MFVYFTTGVFSHILVSKKEADGDGYNSRQISDERLQDVRSKLNDSIQTGIDNIFFMLTCTKEEFREFIRKVQFITILRQEQTPLYSFYKHTFCVRHQTVASRSVDTTSIKFLDTEAQEHIKENEWFDNNLLAIFQQVTLLVHKLTCKNLCFVTN